MTSPTSSTARAFKLYGLLAETFIHAGIGEASSSVDLPIARESTTRFPYIAASSFKGASRDAFRRHWGVDDPKTGERGPSKAENTLFGPADTTGADISAGELLFFDMRLLLLPVRSLAGAARYVTCPELIYRFLADARLAGHEGDQAYEDLESAAQSLVPPDWETAFVADTQPSLFLEELCFEGVLKNAEIGKLSIFAKRLVPSGDGLARMLGERLVVLSDDAFAWFADNALPVRMRNALEESGTKKVRDGALWSEEYLAPSTLLYTAVATRRAPGVAVDIPGAGKKNLLDAFDGLVAAERGYLQVGGNETVGHGWFRVSAVPTP
jgi:CRISPR-associated protein Cmr4